ncbi:DUF2871 family protein [Anaerococcus martiniensis]|uniref:DUF2871 family protein n=1 Tax=Anaerococcus sp. WGS1579 TaxID=3366809 RepID=UPI00372D4AA0
MQLGESLFDIGYLALVVALGVRLLLENSKEAKLFGIMAIVLGIGDSFHLLPRVVSHLSPGGLAAHTSALSWGKFVTSITMTIFYVLYYYFYRKQSGDYDYKKKILIYALAIIRIILVAMPQNNWGGSNESYQWGIYRNIPFLIMGILLIIWSYKQKEKPGLKNMWWLILLSFAFYIPVVLFADKYPAVGSMMMPKTVAYLFIVVYGFKYFIGEFKAKSILASSITMLVMGLLAGAFSREFTKFYSFNEYNYLNLIHTHSLALGFLALMGIYLLVRNNDDRKILAIKKAYHTYMTGLTITVVAMIVKGIFTVVSQGRQTINQAAIAGISGIGHIVLTIGIISLMVKIYKFETENNIIKKSINKKGLAKTS